MFNFSFFDHLFDFFQDFHVDGLDFVTECLFCEITTFIDQSNLGLLKDRKVSILFASPLATVTQVVHIDRNEDLAPLVGFHQAASPVHLGLGLALGGCPAAGGEACDAVLV